jgi:hypothetical protein
MPTLPFRRTVTELAADGTIFNVTSSRTSVVGIDDVRNPETGLSLSETIRETKADIAKMELAKEKMLKTLEELQSIESRKLSPSSPHVDLPQADETKTWDDFSR